MKEMVQKTDKDRIVKETASALIAKIQPQNLLMQVKVITGWVRRNLHYVRDIYGVEELTNPVSVLYNIRAKKNSHSSDCDDYAMLLAALFRSVGFPTRLEALAVNNTQYDHARVSVLIGDTWYPVEGTKNTEVGYGLQSRLPIMAVEI
jgi:transglutaminase-like putative cysteine protease